MKPKIDAIAIARKVSERILQGTASVNAHEEAIVDAAIIILDEFEKVIEPSLSQTTVGPRGRLLDPVAPQGPFGEFDVQTPKQVHALVNGALTAGIDGINAECICGWRSGPRFSSFAASAAFMVHKDGE